MNNFDDGYGAEIGIRMTCKRCSKYAFRKQIGYNTIDAANEDRHSMLDTFEPIPDGWEIRHDIGGWLCPECIKEYNDILEKFKNNKKTCNDITKPLKERSTDDLMRFRNSFICGEETAKEIDQILEDRKYKEKI